MNHGFLLDLARTASFFVLALAIFAPLERFFAARQQKLIRPAFWTDLGYYMINGVVPKLLLIVPISLIAWSVHRIFPSAYFQYMAALPTPVRLAGALVVGDVGYYWAHRWMHRFPVLWRFHAIHHSAVHMDWLVNTRSHPIDILFGRTCSYIPLYLLGLLQPMGHQTDIVPLLFLLIGNLWSFFIHANLNWRFGPLESVVATPAFHHWHHTNDGPAVVDKNFASMMPWIDHLFGTFYLPKHLPAQYGTDTPVPRDLAGQLLYPLAPSAPASSPTRPAAT
jgi:sterol desaturase/sphingolipid hydroxylase (fatty acid hydroxylase superfamily)